MHRGKHTGFTSSFTNVLNSWKVYHHKGLLSEFVKRGKWYVSYRYTIILLSSGSREISCCCRWEKEKKEKLITKIYSVHIFNRKCFGIQINILKYVGHYYMFRELQIKTTRHHCTPIRIFKFQKPDNIKCW